MEIDRTGPAQLERHRPIAPPKQATRESPSSPLEGDSVALHAKLPEAERVQAPAREAPASAAPAPAVKTPPPADGAPGDGITVGPGGTLAQLEPPSPPASARTSPVIPMAEGAERVEAARLAEGMILASGIRPDVRSVLVRDLTAFPLPVLKLLKADGLDVAVVREGQSLADTPLLPTVKPEEYRSLAEKGRAVFDAVASEEAAVTKGELDEARKSGNDDPFHLGMIEYWESSRIEKSLTERLIKENLGFSVCPAREPCNLRELASKHGVESDEDFTEWEKTLRLINEGHVTVADGMLNASKGVLLVPYTYYHGRPVSETTLKSLKVYDSQHVKDALGVHLWEDRLVVLHEDYAADPGREVGHYRIVLHETGHALDHAVDRIPGMGEEHRARIDELYRRDLKDFKGGGPNRFVSPRAVDNVREYFAEAVESYMTVNLGDEHEYYKSADNRDELRRLNPELYGYVDSLMKRSFPAGAS